MNRPVIGLTGGRIRGGEISGNLGVLGDSPVDVFYAHYSQAVLAAGGLPVFLALDADPAEYAASLDGCLITGGNDIDPARYGQSAASTEYPIDHIRDEFETELFAQLAKRSVPTLGVCRGLQLINVALGGTLLQHVPDHARLDAPPDRLHHVLQIDAESLLGALYGPTLEVNSLHHQAVDEVASGLRVTATSPDGGVEGIEHGALPIVAVQWHPEMLPTGASDPLFRWLTEAARR